MLLTEGDRRDGDREEEAVLLTEWDGRDGDRADQGGHCAADGRGQERRTDGDRGEEEAVLLMEGDMRDGMTVIEERRRLCC